MLLQGFGRGPLGHGKALEVNSLRYCPAVGFPSWKNLLTQPFFYPPLGILTIPVMLLSLSKQKYQPHMAWPTFPTLSGHRLLLIVLHYGTSESASRFSSLSLPAQIIDKRRRNRSPIWTSPKF